MAEPPTSRVRIGRRWVLGLDDVTERSFAAPVPESVDIARLLNVAQLTGDELRYLITAAVDGVPRRLMPERLQLTAKQSDALRGRLRRRLKAFREMANPDDFTIRGDSTHLAFQETLPGGTRCWSLAQLGRGFAAIMAKERAGPQSEAGAKSIKQKQNEMFLIFSGVPKRHFGAE